MMINLDILTLVNYFISAFTCCLGVFLTGTIILYKDIKKIRWYQYLILILGTMAIMANSLMFDNIFKTFGIILVLCLMFKLIYKMDIFTSLIITIITYIIFALSEAIFILILAILNLIFDLNLIMDMIKTFLGNIVISLLSFGIAFIVRNNVNEYLKKINKTNIAYTIIIGIVTIFTAISFIFKLYTKNWKIDYIFFLNILIVNGCIVLTMTLLKQYLKNKEIVEKYCLIEEYLKTSAEVVEKYSSTIHKYKNNLIIIKGYINSDINQANEYLDKLLENYKDKKYSWFTKINYIQINSLRYLVYYKLTKAEESNLKICISVSSEIKDINNLNIGNHDVNIILDMIGEYFDNAIYAANESLEKELVLDIFVENNKLVFILSNTYKEKFDIKSIKKNGYTTKGKGHGLGLYEIDKTIRQKEFINSVYEVIDNYFIVKLSLNVINRQIKNKE